MNKISVIIPIYGVEKYIEQCVKSVINQTYKNIEILLIDDGSKDKSGLIIDELAKLDSRIKVVHKKNEGVSAARNTGLDLASGEYVVFVDGDDFIDDEYIEYMLNAIESTKADMVFSYDWHKDNGIKMDYKANNQYQIIICEKAIEEMYLNKIGVAVWNKIYKRDVIEKNKLRFHEEFWFAEGMTFNIEMFQISQKIVSTKCTYYHQVYNPDSAVRKFNLESWECGKKALLFQKNNWKISNKKLINAWNYHFREYNYSIISGIIFSGEIRPYILVLIKCKLKLLKNIWYPLIVDISPKFKIYSLLESYFPIFMAIWKKNFR